MVSMSVGIVSSPLFGGHFTGKGHPERPERSVVIQTALEKAGHLTSSTEIMPRVASQSDLLLVHTPDYIELVKNEIKDLEQGLSQLSTGDVVISPLSNEIAKLGVGAVLAGVDAVMQKQFKRIFCVVRPPGHHACSNIGMGFCIYNNVAIGARYAQKKYGLQRILIVDWDVHHGNGTEEIFAADPSVFYFSTHQQGIYPGTGAGNYEGVGKGKGATMNCPISGDNDSRQKVLAAFGKPLQEAMKNFKPELIFISAGFDAHENDPLGGFNLTTDDFGELTTMVRKMANQYCDGRIISVLEGGYNLEAIAECAVEHVSKLSVQNIH